MGVKVIDWKRDGRFWVVTRHAGKRIIQLVGDREAAEQRAREIRYALKLHEAPYPGAAISVSEALDRWLTVDAANLSASWRTVAESDIRLHLRPAFGARAMRSITRDDVTAYCAAKLTGGEAAQGRLSAASVRRHVSILGRVFEIALERGQARENPTRGAGRWIGRAAENARDEARTVESWTRDEVERIIAAARTLPAPAGALVSLLFASGMRRGEALGLRVEDVDVARGEIVVRRAIVRGAEVPPKSRLARRVAVPAPVLEELRAIVQVGEGRLFAVDESHVNRLMLRAVSKAGARRLHRIVHATRHTYASLALEACAPVAWVAQQLGHASPAITMRIYAHAIPHDSRDLSFACFGAQITAQPMLRVAGERTL